jgi:hypothetical protein
MTTLLVFATVGMVWNYSRPKGTRCIGLYSADSLVAKVFVFGESVEQRADDGSLYLSFPKMGSTVYRLPDGEAVVRPARTLGGCRAEPYPALRTGTASPGIAV